MQKYKQHKICIESLQLEKHIYYHKMNDNIHADSYYTVRVYVVIPFCDKIYAFTS